VNSVTSKRGRERRRGKGGKKKEENEREGKKILTDHIKALTLTTSFTGNSEGKGSNSTPQSRKSKPGHRMILQ
jgi:hypothetical protein